MTSPNDVPRLTDEQLIVLAVEGDERARSELVRRYQETVFEKNFQLIGDWDDADSLTNQTFDHAFRGLSRYQSRQKFRAWLLRIARNAALERLRTKKSPPLPIEGSLLEDTDQARKYLALQVSAREPNPLEDALLLERAEQIRRALARLRPEHREAVLLHMDQVPHEEIARRMGIPINTVRSHISRAREKLRKALEEENEN